MQTDDVLSFLYSRTGEYISGQTVADGLGVTRAAIWKAIESLRADGYVIESSRARGYRLASVPDLLGAREVRLGLKTHTIGSVVHALDEVDSTNSYASRLASGDAPDGTVVVADYQTSGRGRLGRRWESPKGVNIYTSIILRPGFPPAEAPLITLAASVALVTAVRGLYGLAASIKWPNDMLISGKKSAGILTEMSAEPDRVRHIVLGVGIDVNMPLEEFPVEIREISSSVMLELGRKVNRAELMRRFLEEMERCYTMLLRGERAPLLDEWRSLSGMLGRRVRVTTLRGVTEGTALDINESGYLLLQAGDGAVSTITSGDVGII